VKEREVKYMRGLTSQEIIEIWRKSYARKVAMIEKLRQRDEERGLAQAKRLALNQDGFRY
jgi:hypothetical protein